MIRLEAWKHIRKKANEKGIHVDFVGGFNDHCHCLISMTNTQSCDFVMQAIKGESSKYINSVLLPNSKFGWQDGYYAVAVANHRIDQVRNYIKNQEQHHSRIYFKDEYEAMLNRYGFQSNSLSFE